jgi:hypothetical protein
MNEPNQPMPNQFSRVDWNVEELAQEEHDARQLSARVSGTSEETARFFGSKETLIPYE